VDELRRSEDILRNPHNMARPLPKFEEIVNDYLRDIDDNTETPIDQWVEYDKLYHRRLMYDDKNEVVGISYIRAENEMIKIDIYPIGDPETVNPKRLNERCVDGSFYFQDDHQNPPS
jgi:hypothetical protein